MQVRGAGELSDTLLNGLAFELGEKECYLVLLRSDLTRLRVEPAKDTR